MARARAVASPTMPAPMTIADRDCIKTGWLFKFSSEDLCKQPRAPQHQHDPRRSGYIEDIRKEVDPGIFQVDKFLYQQHHHRPEIAKGIREIDQEADISRHPIG